MTRTRTAYLVSYLAGAVLLASAIGPSKAQMMSPATPPASPSPTISSPPPTPDCTIGANGQPGNCPPVRTFGTGGFSGSGAPAPSYITGSSGPASANEEKVLSYFQRGTMRIDTQKAFGFVLLPKSAVTDSEYQLQKQFCYIMLASLDYVAPDTAAQGKFLATYWPVISTAEQNSIELAFTDRDCDTLLGLYDHSLARSIAAKAGVLGMSGPMLITWPSESFLIRNPRDPLIVDFSNADYENATKALSHWFKQVSKRPALWTNYIREGTIRAELADAINETAGVMLAVMAGKWESVKVISDAPSP